MRVFPIYAVGMEFHPAVVVRCSVLDADGNETRRVAEFIGVANPDEAVIYKGCKRDAAWVRLLDGESQTRVPH